MPVELLKTKLIIPPLQPGLVQRLQLFAQLDEVLSRQLALVSAPAGYGKTTLLSAWARHLYGKVAWLSLDNGDNDPVRFYTYLSASLQAIDPGLGQGLLELANPTGFSSFDAPISLSQIQTAFLNRVQSFPTDFVCILDDFHTIESQPVHAFLAFLVEHLPAQMHLVISSRADPPLPLPRLRARGQLVEVRLAQLRFSMDEAAQFLRQTAGPALPSPLLTGEQITALTDRTEGWAAGLQMAALALRGQSAQGSRDLSAYIQAFTGSNRYILDYLVDEVLEHQPPEIQEFLLKTSILDRFCVRLCDSILGDMDQGIRDSPLSTIPYSPSRKILDYLERSNLFLIPLDHEREWYRYHRLFSDLLCKHLRQAYPEQIPELHAAASEWLEENGLAAGAVEHAIAAGLPERAAGLIERESEALLMRGEVTTLVGWMQQLPLNLLYSRPRLDLYYVSCLIMLGESLEACEAGLRRLSEQPDLIFQVFVLRAFLALFQGEYEIVDTLARRALEELPEQESFFRSLASWALTISQIGESDLDRRINLLENLLARSRAVGNRLLWVNALCGLAEVRFRQGKLPLARDLYLEAIRDGVGPDGRKLPVAGEAMIGLGYILREWNELEAAAQYLLEGIDLIRQARLFGTIEGWVALALVRQAQGDATAAQQIIQEIRHTAHAFKLSSLGEQLAEFYAAMILHRLGDSQAYPRYFQSKFASGQNRLAGDAKGSAQLEHSLYKYEQVALAHAFLSQEQPADALSALEPLLPKIVEQGRATLAVEIEILRALALQALNLPVEAQAAFEHALAIAEPGRMVRIFIDEGQPVIPFLHKAIERKICPEYAGRLLAAIEAEEPGGVGCKLQVEGSLAPSAMRPLQNLQPATLKPSTLLEPLSQRELEVLRLLASSLPARDIAGQLFVAESTLNSHIKSIYAKLGVHRRIEAVQRAKELGLI